MRRAFLTLFAAAMIGAFGTTHVFAETPQEHLAKCQKKQNFECKFKKRH
jgi:hypothetical protein